MGSIEERKSIFISHANPEDNAFTIWLGARLTAYGYDVWADVLRLRGGHDWQRILESVLRHKARKVLVVATDTSMQKQGVRNEIQIAHNVSQKIRDSEFIIPLRLSEFDANFLIAHAQYIDFEKSWANGLSELIETLSETYNVPCNRGVQNETADNWRQVHLRNAKTLKHTSEKLVSNWLELDQLPESVFLYTLRNPSIFWNHYEENSGIPVVEFRRGFLSFSPVHDLQENSECSLRNVVVDEIDTETFLKDGWPNQYIKSMDSKSQVVNLIRRSIEIYLLRRGLCAYEMSGDQLAWWGRTDKVPKDMIRFNWAQQALIGRRKIVGYSPSRNLYWHYGISPKPFLFPFPHVRVIHRVVFSRDGLTPIDNPLYMHRLRRSYTKSWRNSKWRDMQLAFLHWISAGEMQIPIPVASDVSIRIRIPPLVYTAPVSVSSDNDYVDDPEPFDELEPVSNEVDMENNIERYL